MIIVFSRITIIKVTCRISRKKREKIPINYQKILEKSNSCFLTSKNSFRIFRGSFGNFFVGNRNYSHPFHQIISIKITKRSSKIANFIFFYKIRKFGGSFGNFYKKISDFYNKFIKSSSKIPFCVFNIAIFHFTEDHFIFLRDFLFRIFPKKTSIFTAFFVRRL